MSQADHPARQGKPDPALELARSVVRGPWVETAQARLRRPYRRDYKGPRKQIATRLPVAVADEFTRVAEGAGFSTSEALALLVHSFLRRRDPL